MKKNYLITFFAVLLGSLNVVLGQGERTVTRTEAEIDGLSYLITEWHDGDVLVKTEVDVIKPIDGSVYTHKKVVIPEYIPYKGNRCKVKYIDSHAFEGCTDLEEVEITGDSIRIDFDAFRNSELKSIKFAPKYTMVNLSAFSGCKNMPEITFNSEFTLVYGEDCGGGPFTESPYFTPADLCFEKITFKGNSDIIGHDEFATMSPRREHVKYEGAATMTVPDGFVIPEQIDIDWGEGVHIIHSCGLSWYNGKKLKLSGNVHLLSHIGCPYLESVEIEPYIANEIDDFMNSYGLGLYGCSDYLRTVICHDAEPRDIRNDTFVDYVDHMNEMTLYVPSSSIEAYKQHAEWSRFGTILPINDGVDGIEVDSEGPGREEYYNLQGVRIDRPQSGEVLIRRQGNKVEKVRI